MLRRGPNGGIGVRGCARAAPRPRPRGPAAPSAAPPCRQAGRGRWRRSPACRSRGATGAPARAARPFPSSAGASTRPRPSGGRRASAPRPAAGGGKRAVLGRVGGELVQHHGEGLHRRRGERDGRPVQRHRLARRHAAPAARWRAARVGASSRSATARRSAPDQPPSASSECARASAATRASTAAAKARGSFARGEAQHRLHHRQRVLGPVVDLARRAASAAPRRPCGPRCRA